MANLYSKEELSKLAKDYMFNTQSQKAYATRLTLARMFNISLKQAHEQIRSLI